MPTLIGRLLGGGKSSSSSAAESSIEAESPIGNDATPSPAARIGRKKSVHIRAKKSLSSLLNRNQGSLIPEVSSSPRSCMESQNYAMPKSKQPDLVAGTKGMQSQKGLWLDGQPDQKSSDASEPWQSIRGSRTSSPSKSSPRGASLSSRRSTNAKSRLQGLADTIRSKTTMFHTFNSSAGEGMSQRKESPTKPVQNAQSCSSRKSVRFRSSNSFISQHERLHRSPISIQSGCAPLLRLIDLPTYGLIVEDSMLESETDQVGLGKTGRPSPSVPNYLPLDFSDSRENSPMKKLARAGADHPGALLTPMPGTNLPLEDPFDDVAAIKGSLLHSVADDGFPSGAMFVSAVSYICEKFLEVADHPFSRRQPAKLRCAGKSSSRIRDSFVSDLSDRNDEIYSFASRETGEPLVKSRISSKEPSASTESRDGKARLVLDLTGGETSTGQVLGQDSFGGILVSSTSDDEDPMSSEFAPKRPRVPQNPTEVLWEGKMKEIQNYRASRKDRDMATTETDMSSLKSSFASMPDLPPHLAVEGSKGRHPVHRATDENQSQVLLNYSSFAREVAEESVQTDSESDGNPAGNSAQKYLGPSPHSSVRSRIKDHKLQNLKHGEQLEYIFSNSADGTPWSPFDEPLFPDAIDSYIRDSSATVAKLLCLEGFTRHFWKSLKLPDATGPPARAHHITQLQAMCLFDAVRDVTSSGEKDEIKYAASSPSTMQISRRSTPGLPFLTADFHCRESRPSPVEEPTDALPRECPQFRPHKPVDLSPFVTRHSAPSRTPAFLKDLEVEAGLHGSDSPLPGFQLPSPLSDDRHALVVSQSPFGRTDQHNDGARAPQISEQKSLLELVMSARAGMSDTSLDAQSYTWSAPASASDSESVIRRVKPSEDEAESEWETDVDMPDFGFKRIEAPSASGEYALSRAN